MEKKQGFFTAMREELAKAWRCVSSDLSRRPLPPMAEHLLLLSRRWKRLGAVEDPALLRLGGLAPLMEGPDTGEEAEWDSARKECGWGQWAWVRLPWPPSGSGSGRRSDLLLMLGVIASPLGPVHVSYAEMPPHLGIKDTPIVRILSVECLLLCLTKSLTYSYEMHVHINKDVSVVLMSP